MKNNAQLIPESQFQSLFMCSQIYSKSCYACLFPKREVLVRQINELYNYIVKLTNDKEQMIKDCQQKQSVIDEYKNKVHDLEKKIQSLEDQKVFNEDYRKKYKNQKNVIKNLEKQITSLEQKNQNKDVGIRDQKIIQLTNEAKELKDQIKNMNQTYIDDIKAYNEKLINEQSKIRTLENQIQSSRQDTIQIQNGIRESQNQIKQTIESKEQKIFDELRRQQDRMISLGEQYQIHQQQYYVDKQVQRLEMKFIRNGRSYFELHSQSQPLFKPIIEEKTYQIKFTNDQNIDIPVYEIKSNVLFIQFIANIFTQYPRLNENRIKKVRIQKTGEVIPKDQWNKEIYLILNQSQDIQHDIHLMQEN